MGLIFNRGQADTYGFFPCAPGCRGSDSDPRACRCVCNGVNHGVLLYGRPVRPIPVPSGPVSMMPEEMPRLGTAPQLALPSPGFHAGRTGDTWFRPSPSLTSGPLPKASYKRRLARGIAKHAFKYVSENVKNETVLKGLHYQFSALRVDAIVNQAYSVYYSHDPDANRPELYELYENGSIDKALELFNVRWVIGRPKL